MAQAPAQAFAHAVFPELLGRLTAVRFAEHAARAGLDEAQALDLTWMDGDGRRWSVLSRLGFLQAMRDSAQGPVALMATALSHHTDRHGGGLARATQPGEPDLLWAWLGVAMQPVLFSSQGDPAVGPALIAAFSNATHPTDAALPASGFGAPGDGGWVDRALGLVEGLLDRGLVPPNLEARVDQWRLHHVLGVTGPLHHPDAHAVWWNLGRAGGASLGAGGEHAALPTVDVSRTLLHALPGRPPALAPWVAAAWNRLAGLNVRALEVHRTPHPSAIFSTLAGLPSTLPSFLNAESVVAVEAFVRAGALASPSDPLQGGVDAAMGLWLRLPEAGKTLTGPEQAAVAWRLAGHLSPPVPRLLGGRLDGGERDGLLERWVARTLLDADLPGAGDDRPGRGAPRL